MKQITEDYVSEEIAKLLKTKGFDVPCDSYYEWFESNVTLYKGHLPEFSDSNINHNKHNDRTSRPSQSLALKWLRKVHGILIRINEYGYPDKEKGRQYTFVAKIRNMKSHRDITQFLNDKPEQAVEAALLYVLKNLI